MADTVAGWLLVLAGLLAIAVGTLVLGALLVVEWLLMVAYKALGKDWPW